MPPQGEPISSQNMAEAPVAKNNIYLYVLIGGVLLLLAGGGAYAYVRTFVPTPEAVSIVQEEPNTPVTEVSTSTIATTSSVSAIPQPAPIPAPAPENPTISIFNRYAAGWGIETYSKKDHVYGDIEHAKYIVLTYGDLESPYTYALLQSMFDLVKTRKDVAWVFRHFPLQQIHRNALKAANASECITKPNQQDGFWTFVKFVMETKTFDVETYNNAAVELGVPQQEFASCWNSDSVITRINGQNNEAIKLGAKGVPYSRIISFSDYQYEMPGSFSPEQIDAILEAM